MSIKTADVDKHTDDSTDSLGLIRQAERHRTTVRRIRELLDGTRNLSQIKAGDWFTTIEYVRDETNTELVLYNEHRYADAAYEARITSFGDDGIWCIVAGWSERAGYTHDKMARWNVEESFRSANPPIRRRNPSTSRWRNSA